jgi:hypothetical protein
MRRTFGASSCSHVLAVYASFPWQQDDEDFGESEQSTAWGQRHRSMASAGAGFGGRVIMDGAVFRRKNGQERCHLLR